MIDFKTDIKKYIDTEISVLNSLNYDEINIAVNSLINTANRGGTIYTLGNGGSAATASHFVCDFAKGVNEYKKDKTNFFRVQCLCDNIPIITAISNDISYDDIFVNQLKTVLREKDLVLCISGSGNSENVVKAAEYAKNIGAEVLSMTGFSGGKLKELSDYSMYAPIDDMQIAEDVHMLFDHMMFRIISQFFNK